MEYGVKSKATGGYQLLTQDLNLLANKVNKADALAKGVRLNIEGVQQGPKKVSATGDIKNIIVGAETELKKFTKKDFKTFQAQLKKYLGKN